MLKNNNFLNNISMLGGSTNEPKIHPKKNIGISVSMVLLVILVCVGGFFLYKHIQSKDKALDEEEERVVAEEEVVEEDDVV